MSKNSLLWIRYVTMFHYYVSHGSWWFIIVYHNCKDVSFPHVMHVAPSDIKCNPIITCPYCMFSRMLNQFCYGIPSIYMWKFVPVLCITYERLFHFNNYISKDVLLLLITFVTLFGINGILFLQVLLECFPVH